MRNIDRVSVMETLLRQREPDTISFRCHGNSFHLFCLQWTPVTPFPCKITRHIKKHHIYLFYRLKGVPSLVQIKHT